ncbi:MAG TPA: hypothetical protein VI197_15430 [Polyangiaceae bacterium]
MATPPGGPRPGDGESAHPSGSTHRLALGLEAAALEVRPFDLQVRPFDLQALPLEALSARQ